MHSERTVLKYQVATAGGKDIPCSVAVVSLALEHWSDSGQLCNHQWVTSTQAVRELNRCWYMTAISLEKM